MKHILKNIIILATLTIFIITASTYGKDTDTIATVIAIRGRITATSPKDTTRPLAINGSLYKGDTIKTGSRGRMQIMFIDNSIINLGRNTEMVIEEFIYDKKNKKGALVTNVKEGVFRVMGGAISKIAPQNFKTKTPTATIGIRGSMYAGEVRQGQLTIVFLGGHGITVTNQLGQRLITKPGFGISKLNIGAKPTKAKHIKIQNLTKLLNNFAGHIPKNGLNNGKPTIKNKKHLKKLVKKQISEQTKLKQNILNNHLFPPPATPNKNIHWAGFFVSDNEKQTFTDRNMLTILKNNHPEQYSEIFSWGYWTDTSTKSGYWLAGIQTMPNYIQGLMQTPTASGTYQGDSIITITQGANSQKLNGTSLVRVFFNNRTVHTTLNFSELTIQANAMINQAGNQYLGIVNTITHKGINQTITNSSIQGKFFGPAANTTAGTLQAKTATKSMHAIFKANK